ncbi:GNAT family N-acetyltransferase [Glutamicibacter endophyticus]|uniref:GNAT family N-acetyltransferase n=1 Tax=Glutamicibacter endophyticus TaxID=1522174 RepID=UPI003AF175F8
MQHTDFPQILDPAAPLVEHLTASEARLLDPAVRHDEKSLRELLHPHFTEVGVSGTSYDFAAIVALLQAEPAADAGPGVPGKVLAPQLCLLAPQTALLRWRSETGSVPAHRSSLWQKHEGEWRLLFHQGTATSEPLPAAAAELEQPNADDAPRSTAAHPAAPHDGIFLRPLEPEDAQAVLAAFDSDAAAMARQGQVTTMAEAEQYVARLLDPANLQLPLAIATEDGLAGLVSAGIDATNNNAWVWYWMHAAYRGRGVVSAALRTLARVLFDTHGIHRLELGLRVNNPGSRRVAERAGFICEGRERGKFLIDGQRVDTLMYSRLASDPRPLSARELPLHQ